MPKKVQDWIGFCGCGVADTLLRVGWRGGLAAGRHNKIFKSELEGDGDRPQTILEFDCPKCDTNHRVDFQWRIRTMEPIEPVDIELERPK